jgi:hypothetical protein
MAKGCLLLAVICTQRVATAAAAAMHPCKQYGQILPGGIISARKFEPWKCRVLLVLACH